MNGKNHKSSFTCVGPIKGLFWTPSPCGAEGIRGPFPWCLSWGHWVSLSLGHAVTRTSGKSRLWEAVGLLMVGVNPTMETLSQRWK